MHKGVFTNTHELSSMHKYVNYHLLYITLWCSIILIIHAQIHLVDVWLYMMPKFFQTYEWPCMLHWMFVCWQNHVLRKGYTGIHFNMHDCTSLNSFTVPPMYTHDHAWHDGTWHLGIWFLGILSKILFAFYVSNLPQ